MSLLAGLRVVQIGGGFAAAVCGRLFADVGAEIVRIGPDCSSPLGQQLNRGEAPAVDPGRALSAADLIVCEGAPAELRARGHDAAVLRTFNARAPLVYISPFGQTGPKANDPASDLTLLFSSGVARLLTGQVDDLGEAPIRPVGEQSAFIGGLAAACAGMHAVLSPEPGAVIDVSIEEALATLAITELARAGLTGRSRPRKRVGDGNGATVTILPARDGFTAISPREDRQWAAWLTVMGSPDWGNDRRFATKPDRVANWDALHALMSAWSRGHDKEWIAERAQAAHVPSFPLREPAEQLASPHLDHRKFWRPIEVGGRSLKAPGSPFGLCSTPGRRRTQHEKPGNLPLSGIRILDFSWVIAGPTTTRHLAAMGAEVIKIETPGRGDPGRAAELHTVLGQAKKSITLDLKNPKAVEIAQALAGKSDVLVENFATGVMDRLGLGAEAVERVNPALIYVSASGLGRTGPEARAVAYGTLLQCYAGFAGLNRHPGVAPRVGFAWLDPMCGLMLAFGVAAALWQRRRSGAVARIDFSMIEAMLWTMAEPLLTTQLDRRPTPAGNRSDVYCPHDVYGCLGEDDWIGLAVRGDEEWRKLCAIVPGLAAMIELGLGERLARRSAIDGAFAAWAGARTSADAAGALLRAGIPAAALASSVDLVNSRHLREREFWEPHDAGVLPGLPWRPSLAAARARPRSSAPIRRAFSRRCSA